jgi:hypothetical protein
MARPKKNNADYFSHDNDMRNDEKIKAVRRKFKHEGYSIWNMMLEKLSKSDGFTMKYNDMNLELWAGDFEVETDKLKEILEYFQKIELLINLEGEIFSENMIRRFSGLIGKRNKQREEFQKQKPAEKTVSESESTQSKVKETIVKESKVNKTIEEREKDFIAEVNLAIDHPPERLKKFIDYWAEKSPRSKKMRFEHELVFDIKKRLVTWAANELKFNSNGKDSNTVRKDLTSTLQTSGSSGFGKL